MIDVKELRRCAEAMLKDDVLTEDYILYKTMENPGLILELLDCLAAADEMTEEACDDPAYAEKFWAAHAKYRALREGK